MRWAEPMIVKREPSRATPLVRAKSTIEATYRPSGAAAASVWSASIACFSVQGIASEASVAAPRQKTPAA